MVIILTGAPASGKSTVAERLASCLDRAAHIQVDFFRKMVKGGYASPHHWNDEVDRQYRIARMSAAQTAPNLAAAGFLPILDDIVPPAWVDEWRHELDGLDCRFVVLCPRLEVAQRPWMRPSSPSSTPCWKDRTRRAGSSSTARRGRWTMRWRPWPAGSRSSLARAEKNPPPQLSEANVLTWRHDGLPPGHDLREPRSSEGRRLHPAAGGSARSQARR